MEEATMTTADRTTATITARIPKELRGELDALAKSTGRNKNALIEEALRRFVEVERWQIALIEERLRQVDAGEVSYASEEDVARVYAKFNVTRRDRDERAAG